VNVLRILLLPFSFLYAVAVEVRNSLFNWGILRSRPLGAKTVSVGNITVGGTGKTPLVAYIARYLQQKGRRVAILSRGYGRKSDGFVLVSDGKKILASSTVSGDEPYALAKELPAVIIGVDNNRPRAAETIQRRFSVDIFLLDDGFQHRRAKRDLDIVTISAKDDSLPFLLPAGYRRERLKSLSRANHIVLTRAGECGSDPAMLESIRKKCQRYSHADLSAVDFIGRSLVNLASGVEEPIEKFRGKKAFLFCGIADPKSFETLVESIGIHLCGKKCFHDHYDFQGRDFASLRNDFLQSHCDFLLTTLKDAARLSGTQQGGTFVKELPVYGLSIEVAFLRGREAFHNHLDKICP
jgi:tetraacyldisaccharide 4'-kinase